MCIKILCTKCFPLVFYYLVKVFITILVAYSYKWHESGSSFLFFCLIKFLFSSITLIYFWLPFLYIQSSYCNLCGIHLIVLLKKKKRLVVFI
jgi:hypothetical protein